MLVVPNASDLLMLQFVINQTGLDGGAPSAGGNRVLRLFSNNATISKSITAAGLTEVTAAGYAGISLLGANWTTSTISGINTAVYPVQTFTMTASATVYGYYVTTAETTPRLLWVEKFTDGPYTVPPGAQVLVTPTFTLN